MSYEQHTTLPVIQRIPFHEDELYAIRDDHTGKEYVLPKPMVEIFGLTWPAQFAKLKKNKLFSRGIAKIVIPTMSGEQETILLERRLVHAWLLSIDVNRVLADRQDKLLRYQEECADVLDAYFSKGVAVNPRSRGDLLVDMAIAYREQEQRITQLEAQQRAYLTEMLRAQEMALTALRSQQWLSIRQHCLIYDLTAKMPVSLQNDYGRWLRGYCLEKGIPVYKIATADRQWKEENTYPAQVIVDTLSTWLMRHHSQPALTIVTPAESSETCQDAHTPYTPRRRRTRGGS